ncbi:hypothetical protein GCM10020331_060440 [Ectobacillus funiculus]
MVEKKKTKRYKEGPFMNILRRRIFDQYSDAHMTYGSITTPRRKELQLEKHILMMPLQLQGSQTSKKVRVTFSTSNNLERKKRSLHEATARKGRKREE